MTSSGTSGRTASWTRTVSSGSASRLRSPFRVLSFRVAPPATTGRDRRTRPRRRARRVSVSQSGCATTTTRSTPAASTVRRLRVRTCSPGESQELFRQLAAEPVAVAAGQEDGMDAHRDSLRRNRPPGPHRVSSGPWSRPCLRVPRRRPPRRPRARDRLAPLGARAGRRPRAPGIASAPTTDAGSVSSAPVARAAMPPTRAWSEGDDLLLRFNVMQGPGQDRLRKGAGR